MSGVRIASPALKDKPLLRLHYVQLEWSNVASAILERDHHETKEIHMGWGRTLLLGDVGNRLDIADTERDIKYLHQKITNKSKVDQQQEVRLTELEIENDQIKLYLASLIRLLVSKGTLSQDELHAFVDIIDDD